MSPWLHRELTPAICLATVHPCTPMSAQRYETDKADGLGTAI